MRDYIARVIIIKHSYFLTKRASFSPLGWSGELMYNSRDDKSFTRVRNYRPTPGDIVCFPR
jgi:hypothetical protein